MNNAVELPETREIHRVLIVDDDVDFSDSMREVIESQGNCIVKRAATLHEARQELASFLPEVVLIDVRLGKSKGSDLLDDIIHHHGAPTCVMVTGYANTDSVIDALHTGAYDYLTKPVTARKLLGTLDRCFERNRLEMERAEALHSLALRNRELEQVNERLHGVVKCMGELTTSPSVVDLCELLLEKVAQNMGAEGGSVYVCEDNQLVLKHSLDPGHAPHVIPMPISANSVLGRVMEQAEAVLVSNAASREGLMLSGWSGYQDESLLALPLVGQDGTVLGVLSLHTKHKPPFTSQDCDVGRILLAASCETLRAVKALEELQASEEHIRLLLNSTNDGIYGLDEEGNCTFVNASCLQILEYGEEDLFRRNMVELVHHLQLKNMSFRPMECKVCSTLTDGISNNSQAEMWRADGSCFMAEYTCDPVFEKGAVTGCVVTFRDITDRIAIENELEESRIMLQLIIDSVPECVKVLDKEGRIIQMNKGGLDLCEAETFDQVKGECLYPFVKSEYREALQKLNDQILEEGVTGKMEYVLTGLKGKESWLDTRVVPLRNVDQKIIGVLGVTRDITEDKRLLEKTRQQELQLMQANKISALGTLVAGVAHEINNPNQTIQINSGLMVDVWRDTEKILDQHAEMHGDFRLCSLPYSEVRASYASMVRDIRDGAEQIRTVVDRLRTFARPDGGIHERARGEKIQVNEAMETAFALLGHAIRKGTDNFTKNLAEDLPEVSGNRQHLQQIVINLLLNSLESLQNKSAAIQVETRLDVEHACVSLIVSDEGVGIQAEDMERIMEPFFTTKREAGGTGLGLSITHNLVLELGATLQMESEPGEGTRATVSFPTEIH